MSLDENKAIARRFGSLWGSDWSESIIDELAASDLLVSYPLMPQPARGPEEFKQTLRMVHSAFPDLEVAIDDLVAENDLVAVRWKCWGTHKGDMMGIPASNKSVEWTGMTFTASPTARYWRKLAKTTDWACCGRWVPFPPELTAR